MFKSLSIENYRGFRKLSLEPLERVNLIVGSNDVGKTALLEGIFLLIGETNLSLVTRINAFRGLTTLQGDPDSIGEWLWTPLFHRFETEKAIKIEGKTTKDIKRTLRLELVPRTSAVVSPPDGKVRTASNGFSSQALKAEYSDDSGKRHSTIMLFDEAGMLRIEPLPSPPSFPGYFMSARGAVTLEEDAKNFGKLEVEEQSYDFVRVLQIIEPRLTRVSTILGAGGAMLWGDVGLGRMLPLALLGDGLGRFSSLMLKIATARRGVVLVDEIENGLYHAVMEKAWTAIAEAARLFDVQLFATTHSWECVVAAHQSFEDTGRYDFRLHRLERIGDTISALGYDQQTLAAALKAGLEVR